MSEDIAHLGGGRVKGKSKRYDQARQGLLQKLWGWSGPHTVFSVPPSLVTHEGKPLMAAGATGSTNLIDRVTNISDFIWGGTWNGDPLPWLSIAGQPIPPMTLILLGVGLWVMFGLRFYPILKLGSAFSGLFKGRKSSGAGEISPFAALSTALSGQVGTGNLAGVATAIALGGPGAIFWMWITALVGMALAFAEGSLAIRYRLLPKTIG